MTDFIRRAALLAAVFLVFQAAPAAAEPVTELRLISSVEKHDGTDFLAGVEVGLAPGWKTYWRRPGDSGLAPEFDWSASENVALVELRWPAPERFDEAGDITFGYKQGVVWPLRVIPEEAGKPVVLRLAMSYGICADMCIPREGTLALAVLAGEESAETPEAAMLRAALARVPVALEETDRVELAWRENSAPVLEVRLKDCSRNCTPPVLILDGPRNVWFGTPSVSREGDTIRYAMEAEVLSPAMVEGEDILLIFSGPGGAFEVHKKL
ncbi:MAG: hypothetical protein KF895_06585 [Parvibaculum sp.]|nr:hypothetical protein [Parvibaculum sp.]